MVPNGLITTTRTTGGTYGDTSDVDSTPEWYCDTDSAGGVYYSRRGYGVYYEVSITETIPVEVEQFEYDIIIHYFIPIIVVFEKIVIIFKEYFAFLTRDRAPPILLI